MIINSLKLMNFRCFSHAKIALNEKINVFYGKNACGKSSILESFYCLSSTKSFRTNNLNELISYNGKYFVIECCFIKNSLPHNILFSFDEKNKKIKDNGITYDRINDYLGTVNVVLFSSNDLFLLKSSPIERRKIFELNFCQISKEYFESSSNYRKILKSRNALLKRLKFENRPNDKALLDILDEQLINSGKKIITFRQKFLNKINEYAFAEHYKISENKEILEIKYLMSADQDEFEKKLKESREMDLQKGYTNVGPHRDDYIFIINNKNIIKYCSQGQQRNALLSTKLAIGDLVYEYLNDYPIMLFDDVFSELDESRQNNFINSISSNYQIIITTASLNELKMKALAKSTLINVEEMEKNDGK